MTSSSVRPVAVGRTRTAAVLFPLLAIMQACGGGGGGGNGGGGGDGSGGNGGGGGSGGGGSGNPTLPGAFSADLQFDDGAERFLATWNAASDAQRYRVLLKRNEASAFIPLSGADELPATTLDFSFAVGFTVQWDAAVLRVEACNAAGCSAAADVPLLPQLVSALAQKHLLSATDADELQIACSADGNTLVIGAPRKSSDDGLMVEAGAVYVFTRSATTWTQQPTLIRAANAEARDNFGHAVALSADGATLAVGAPQEDGSRTSTVDEENNDAPQAGAVYVFVRNGASYDFQAYLKANPILDAAIGGDLFGSAVALAADGQTLVVGAPFAEAFFRPTDFNEGAAYVFTRGTASWTQRTVLGGPHTDGNENDQFGLSVAASADGATLAIGAPFDDGDAQSTFENPNTNARGAGVAYIFATTNRNQWPLQAFLKAPNAQASDMLGTAVALSADGNTVAIGATGEDGDATSTLSQDNNNLSGAGAVYVFSRDGATWASTPAYLKPSSSGERADFGGSLSLTSSGDELAIGAPFDRSALPGEGAAFVFVRAGGSWLEQGRLADAATQEFGVVAFTGDGLTLFVGAESSTILPRIGEVRVY